MTKHKFLLIIITVLLVCIITVNEAKKKRKLHGPGMSHKESTTCAEFSKYGRFNPYSVLNETWFVFFYWSAPRPTDAYRFFIPTGNQTKMLHKVLDGKVTIPVNWTSRLVIMQSRYNTTWLLVERGNRGQYWSYLLRKARKTLIKAQDIRLRQVDNGRLLGFMQCKTEYLYVMSRIREVPLHNKLQEEAARFGFRARRGKSYLYQGHEWMPIPEADENDYFETIFPEIANETHNPEQMTLHVSDQSTEDQKTCSLKEKLSKYKSVDLDSIDSCIRAESSEVSKEADSMKPRIYKTDSNNERADFDDEREQKVQPDEEKSEKANYDNTETEKANYDKSGTAKNDQKEKVDSDNLRADNAAAQSHRLENVDFNVGSESQFTNEPKELDPTNDQKEKVDSDNLRAENAAPESQRLENVDFNVGSGFQFTNEPKEPDPTNEYVAHSPKIQTTSSSKFLGEPEKVNDKREDQYANGLKESESSFAIKRDFEKSTDVPSDTKVSTDFAEDVTDDLPNDWQDFHRNSYTTYLRPVENTNFIEQEPPKTIHKIKDPIASSGVLPEKCYKMEMVSETEDYTPAYVPPIFNEIHETETTVNSENRMQEKQQH